MTTRPTEVAGADAIFLRMEDSSTPGHTLKVVVLDTGRRGRPLSVDEVAEALPDYLALSPRFTSRVRAVGRRMYWIRDHRLDVRDHLDEQVLPEATAAALDRLCAKLATRQLDRGRPLWALTLVHGMPEGRQAIVLRVHHAVMDGSASINLLQAVSTDVPGTRAAVEPRGVRTPPARAALHQRAQLVMAAAVASRQLTKAFGPARRVPKGLVPRSVLNSPSGPERLCASRDISFDDVRRLSALAGSTVNGAFHAVLAQALRSELEAQGITVSSPLVATFGVVEDGKSDRCDGNEVATSRVWLHAEQQDPQALLSLTAASCTEAVALRRHRGFLLHRRAIELIDKIAPPVRAAVAGITPVVINHITTANVAGPRARRWFGDIEIVGLTSYSLAIAPADVSITGYSYAGRMWLGLVTTPESMSDPAGFLDRVEAGLEELLRSAAEAAQDAPPQAQPPGPQPGRTQP